MPSVELVPFHGDHIEATRDTADSCDVSIARICENLGMDASKEVKRLNSLHWAKTGMVFVTGVDGIERGMPVIPLKSLPMWLAGINSRNVAKEMRGKLESYQIEAHDVLAAHFMPQRTIAPVMDEMDLLVAIATKLRDQDHRIKEQAQKIDDTVARVDQIEQSRNRAQGKLRTLPDAVVNAPQKSPCDLTEQRVRFWCGANNADFQDAWLRLYEEFRRRCGIDARRIAKNHTDKYKRVLDVVRDRDPATQETFYAIACEMFTLEPKIAM